jgi:hypothetical protein
MLYYTSYRNETKEIVMKEYLPAWYEAYVASDQQDTHAVFMDLTGLTRHEAKTLCYKIAYSVSESDVIQAYNQTKENDYGTM